MKIRKFEDLECWKAARVLATSTYNYSNYGKISKDFDLRNQLRRAAISVMNNIAEGFRRYSRKEFKRFLDIAQSSAAEVKSMLYIIEDIGYMNSKELHHLHIQVDRARALCFGMIKYVSRTIKNKL